MEKNTQEKKIIGKVSRDGLGNLATKKTSYGAVAYNLEKKQKDSFQNNDVVEKLDEKNPTNRLQDLKLSIDNELSGIDNDDSMSGTEKAQAKAELRELWIQKSAEIRAEMSNDSRVYKINKETGEKVLVEEEENIEKLESEGKEIALENSKLENQESWKDVVLGEKKSINESSEIYIKTSLKDNEIAYKRALENGNKNLAEQLFKQREKIFEKNGLERETLINQENSNAENIVVSDENKGLSEEKIKELSLKESKKERAQEIRLISKEFKDVDTRFQRLKEDSEKKGFFGRVFSKLDSTKSENIDLKNLQEQRENLARKKAELLNNFVDKNGDLKDVDKKIKFLEGRNSELKNSEEKISGAGGEIFNGIKDVYKKSFGKLSPEKRMLLGISIGSTIGALTGGFAGVAAYGMRFLSGLGAGYITSEFIESVYGKKGLEKLTEQEKEKLNKNKDSLGENNISMNELAILMRESAEKIESSENRRKITKVVGSGLVAFLTARNISDVLPEGVGVENKIPKNTVLANTNLEIDSPSEDKGYLTQKEINELVKEENIKGNLVDVLPGEISAEGEVPENTNKKVSIENNTSDEVIDNVEVENIKESVSPETNSKVKMVTLEKSTSASAVDSKKLSLELNSEKTIENFSSMENIKVEKTLYHTLEKVLEEKFPELDEAQIENIKGNLVDVKGLKVENGYLNMKEFSSLLSEKVVDTRTGIEYENLIDRSNNLSMIDKENLLKNYSIVEKGESSELNEYPPHNTQATVDQDYGKKPIVLDGLTLKGGIDPVSGELYKNDMERIDLLEKQNQAYEISKYLNLELNIIDREIHKINNPGFWASLFGGDNPEQKTSKIQELEVKKNEVQREIQMVEKKMQPVEKNSTTERVVEQKTVYEKDGGGNFERKEISKPVLEKNTPVQKEQYYKQESNLNSNWDHKINHSTNKPLILESFNNSNHLKDIDVESVGNKYLLINRNSPGTLEIINKNTLSGKPEAISVVEDNGKFYITGTNSQGEKLNSVVVNKVSDILKVSKLDIKNENWSNEEVF